MTRRSGGALVSFRISFRKKEVSGRSRKHVPDFLLLTSSGPVVGWSMRNPWGEVEPHALPACGFTDFFRNARKAAPSRPSSDAVDGFDGAVAKESVPGGGVRVPRAWWSPGIRR